MAWFTDWWNEIGTMGQVLACFAIPGSLLLVIQTVMLILGGVFGHGGESGGHGGHDISHDVGHGMGHGIGHGIGHDFGAAHVAHGIDLDGDGTIDVYLPEGGFVHEFDHSVAEGHSDASGGHGLRLFTVRGIVAFFAVGGWVGLAVWDNSRSEAFALFAAIASGLLALFFAALVIKLALKLQEDGNISPLNAVGSIATVYIPIPPNRKSTGRITLTLQERFVELEAFTDSNEKLSTGESVLIVGSVGGTLLVRPTVKDETEKKRKPVTAR